MTPEDWVHNVEDGMEAGGKHSSRNRKPRAYILSPEPQGDFLISKPSPSDKIPPTRQCLPKLPKHHHPLGTKYLNSQDYGVSFLIQTTPLDPCEWTCGGMQWPL